MHIFLENVRTEVERLSGKDSYLSASIFWRIQQELNYEKENGKELREQKDFEEAGTLAMNSFAFPESWNLKEEILSWQTAVLRDVTREFYCNWEKVLRSRFFMPAKFKDGKECMVLESFCEEASLDPTTLYTQMVDLLIVATQLCTAANTALDEIKRLTEFESNFLDKETDNRFLIKRFESESRNTILSQSIRKIEEFSKICEKNSTVKGSAYFFHWKMAHEEIESILAILKTFFTYRRVENFELELVRWVKEMFPERFMNGRRNLLCESQLHHEIVLKLTCTTNMLYLHVAKNEKTIFLKRDEIIRENLTRIFREQTKKEIKSRKNHSVMTFHQRILSRKQIN